MEKRFLLFVTSAVLLCTACLGETEKLEILMPPYDVEEEDTYLCTAIKLPGKPMKLEAVEPRSDQDTVHHMLLFGCNTPAYADPVWTCHHSNICKEQDVIIYGWGRNAEKVQYPEGVAFSVGEGTGILTLVLQVHYLIKRPKNESSGVILSLTERASEKTASILEYAAGFVIPPGQEKYPVDNECCYSGFEPITTVAFRVHTHAMGRKVYMTKRTSTLSNGSLIAERDPLLPQGFVQVKEATTVFPGERLKVTCDFYSADKTKAVSVGATHADEMCNMYMLIFSEIPHFGICSDDQGFYFSQKTGVMKENDAFQQEQDLSNFWKGPDVAENKDIGEVTSFSMKKFCKSDVQGVSVERGNDGRIWFLHRGDRSMDMTSIEERYYVKDTALVETDAVLVLNHSSGQIETKWGANFFSVPHMINIGPDGNVWITDVGKHQVFQFSPDGELLLTLGEKFVPGDGPSHFCSPTDVAVLTNGSILVTDGYCNKRIALFDPQGNFVQEVKDSQLSVPHSLVVDECGDVFYVADRDNGKIVYYRLSTMERLGDISFDADVMALTRGPYNTFLALVWKKGSNAEIFQFSRTIRNARIKAGWQVESPGFPHDLTLSAAPVELTGLGDRFFALYIAEVTGKKLSKFILSPPSFNASHPYMVPERTNIMSSSSDTETEPPRATKVSQRLAIVKAHLHRNITFRSASAMPVRVLDMNLFLVLCTLTVIGLVLYYLKKPRRVRQM